MPKVTFLVEVDFDQPFDDLEQKRYVCASIEESFGVLWHDYMVNQDVAPQTPKKVNVRYRDGTST